MDDNYNSESQFELFPGSSEYNFDDKKIALKIKGLTLPLENIIVLTIVFIMTMVFFFSFGVERGKKISMLGNKFNENEALVNATEKKDQSTSLLSEGIADNNVSKIIVKQEVSQREQEVKENPVKLKDISKDIFTIQVASFKKKDKAKQEAKRLKGIGHDTFVLAKGNYSIVCVGKFVQKKEAKEFSNKLRSRYNDLYVRRF